MNILLTGCAGFIGSHCLTALLNRGHTVIGVDNFDPYYPRTVKEENLRQSLAGIKPEALNDTLELHELDLSDNESVQKIREIAKSQRIDVVLHLAGKAGVRPSLLDPQAYHRANTLATQHLLDICRDHSIASLVLGSSSSVYGINKDVPWNEDSQPLPISPYACSKLACEFLCHTYSKLYNINTTALRFFTVYGPRQRPDLAIRMFMDQILQDKPLLVYGDGESRRDYTFIDDITLAITQVTENTPDGFSLLNIGSGNPVSLREMVATIESVLNKKAIILRSQDQLGDVPYTWANIERARNIIGYSPSVDFREGVTRLWEWLRDLQPPYSLPRRE